MWARRRVTVVLPLVPVTARIDGPALLGDRAGDVAAQHVEPRHIQTQELRRQLG